LYGVAFEQPEPPDAELADGDRLSLGSTTFEVIHLPGHSPGQVAFRSGDVVFGGDVLFAGSIGRTDLPLGDPARMQESLMRICELDDRTVVHPGHGPSTTIGRERATNGFLTGLARIARR
jgi:glyoxylase-like metal-dependent hydrolase (beta-lactamase superfamily II)